MFSNVRKRSDCRNQTCGRHGSLRRRWWRHVWRHNSVDCDAMTQLTHCRWVALWRWRGKWRIGFYFEERARRWNCCVEIVTHHVWFLMLRDAIMTGFCDAVMTRFCDAVMTRFCDVNVTQFCDVRFRHASQTVARSGTSHESDVELWSWRSRGRRNWLTSRNYLWWGRRRRRWC
jgi:hypothetical protein